MAYMGALSQANPNPQKGDNFTSTDPKMLNSTPEFTNSTPQGSMLASPLSQGQDISNPLSQSETNNPVKQPGLSGASSAQEKLDKASLDLEALLSKKGGDTPWFRIAAGFLKPTRSGSFGESVGNAAENMANFQESEESKKIPLAQAKIGVLQNKLAQQKELDVRTLLPHLYTTVKDENGIDRSVFNPQVAQQLGGITGDPKYLAMIPEENRKNQLQQFRNNLYKNEDGTNGFNAKAFKQLYSIDSKEALDAVKAIPEMRRYGLLPSTGAEGTPFDALALTAEGPFKAQAQQLADRYRKGLIKDEDADKMAGQLLTSMTSHMDRASALAQSQATHSLSRIIAENSLEFRKETEKNKREDKLTKEEDKQNEIKKKNEQLRDAQVSSADNTIRAVEELRNHPGRMTGLENYDPRQVIPGTNQYDFIEALKTAKSNIFSSTAQSMKGLGALSNLEGEKLSALYGSLKPEMSKAAFDKTLDQINKIMNEHKIRAEKLVAEPPKGSKPVDLDEIAIQWARSNPKNPQSKEILRLHGLTE